jgi:hypothetical protein
MKLKNTLVGKLISARKQSNLIQWFVGKSLEPLHKIT